MLTDAGFLYLELKPMRPKGAQLDLLGAKNAEEEPA